MTGCYKRVGRSCVPDDAGLCVHCSCPVTSRSISRAPRRLALSVRWTDPPEPDPRWSSFNYAAQSPASRRNVDLNLGPRIAAGLAAVRSRR